MPKEFLKKDLKILLTLAVIIVAVSYFSFFYVGEPIQKLYFPGGPIITVYYGSEIPNNTRIAFGDGFDSQNATLLHGSITANNSVAIFVLTITEFQNYTGKYIDYTYVNSTHGINHYMSIEPNGTPPEYLYKTGFSKHPSVNLQISPEHKYWIVLIGQHGVNVFGFTGNLAIYNPPLLSLKLL